ncbi:MAG: UbiA family prenyltransferase [Planctomycetota bacterium]
MRRFLPYFQLCRLPAVFSAIADICCGFALTHLHPPTLQPYPIFALLVLASCSLYLAGMILNDVFDRQIDAQERPRRPIPSGRVSLQSAIRLAVILLIVGNIAAVCAGFTSSCVAVILTACILGYDGGLKNTVLGPVVMGSCRFFNILLGASAVGGFPELFAAPQLPVAVGLGIYITGVTIFSRQEAATSSRLMLTFGAGVINLGLAILMGFILNFPTPISSKYLTLAGFLAIVLTIDRRVLGSLSQPSAGRVQATVKTMLMSLVSLNAILIFHATGRPEIATGVLALLLPAMYLGRWMSIT